LTGQRKKASMSSLWGHGRTAHGSTHCDGNFVWPPPEPPRENRDTAAVAAGREPSVASPAVIATRAMAPGAREVRCPGGRGEAIAQKRRA